MSVKCPKCPKSLSSERNLRNHLIKKIPCDYVCRKCGVPCNYRQKYYRHLAKEHPALNPKTENAVIPFNITPIDDFKVTIDTNIGEVTIRPRNTAEKERLFSLLRTSPGSLMQALTHLDDDYSEYLQNTLGALLSMVHIQPSHPELHSICLTDINRRSVSFYSRTDVNGNDCRWIVHPQESSMQVLTQHARDLFSCLLHTGIAALVIQVWINDEIVFTMKVKSKTLLIRYERAYDRIHVRTGIYKNLTACPASRGEEAAELLRIIEERKEQLLDEIKQAIPIREDINAFLDRGRPICYQSLLRT